MKEEKKSQILKLLEKHSKAYIDGKINIYELEGIVRRKLGLSHQEFCDLIEELEEEGKIVLELGKNKVDLFVSVKR